MKSVYTLADINQALMLALSPTSLSVRDDSSQHIGHGGYVEGVITHIHIAIASAELAALSRVNAHRLVNQAVEPFMARGLHAVAIDIVR